MPKIKHPTKVDSPSFARALTPEARENQLIALAYDLVEQRLRDGTATSQETTHFLKMGSTKEKLEKQLMEEDCKLRRAKTEAMENQTHSDELYAKVIDALKRYSGHFEDEEYDEDLY